MPKSVLISEMASAPEASAAFAISVMSVTFGVSFTIMGLVAASRHAETTRSTLGTWRAERKAASVDVRARDIDLVRVGLTVLFKRLDHGNVFFKAVADTFTIAGTPWLLSHGKSTSHKCFTPGFCKPMELSMPEGVSAMRGDSLPSQPLSETPLVVTAPIPATFTKSEYSRPAANVPLASVTGWP